MDVETLLAQIHEVCPLPATAQRVATLSAREDVAIAEVASALATDPALAAETMRIANSAGFGGFRKVETLERAVMTLGLNELNTMATAMAMMAAFANEDERSSRIHQRSVVAGSLARKLAKPLKLPPSVAFLAGLLAEVGALACFAVDATSYGQIFDQAGGDEVARRTLERQRYGESSRRVGAALLDQNQLPESVSGAVGADDDEEDPTPMGALVRFARAAVPPLVHAAQSGDRVGLGDALDALAVAHHLPLQGDVLFDICLDAARDAARALA
ncbi:MAG: HDOD domain-containing protein [Deltaproteobacteria bacterium]|nr:HDOD domain-containing protein [Deltaproteobacteria bacterium]